MENIYWIIIAVAVLVVAAVGIWGFLRFRRLTTAFGMFDCDFRVAKAGAGVNDAWIQGLCEYQSDRLLWWRSYSLSISASRTWLRDHFDLTGRIPLDQVGQPEIYLVSCKYEGVPFELMMSAEAYHGLASWVESAPPTPRGYDY